MKNINICNIPDMYPAESYTLEILLRKLRERDVLVNQEEGLETLSLQIGVKGSGKPEEFTIDRPESDVVQIRGNDQNALIYGIGKFLRECTFADGAFDAGSFTGTCSPDKPIRGMYFATHFNNFYHEAPVQVINEYVEDLALWGCNALNVWFDMHHYTGILDPAAQAMIAKLKIILAAAKRIGMMGSIVTLANEGYSTTPEELKSVPTQTAHYGVEICPSKPGGIEMIKYLRREMLLAFKEVEPDLVWMGPYDQGGCDCPKCSPWGYNGYLRAGEAEAEVIKEVLPNAKIVVSTWCFDYFFENEYENFRKALEAGKLPWADYLMIDAHEEFPKYVVENGVPGNLPALGFPEISMYYMAPWGGYGANPLPSHVQHMWDISGPIVCGGFPYSEGIFEDMNKAICLQHYWKVDKKAEETVREYGRYEFGADPDLIEKIASLMEADHWHFKGENNENAFELRQTEHVEECLKLTEKAAEGVPAWAVQSWRWRIFQIRAILDHELATSGGKRTPTADVLFNELSDMYYADRGDYRVSPPSEKNFKRLFGE